MFLVSPAFADGFFTTSATWEAPKCVVFYFCFFFFFPEMIVENCKHIKFSLFWVFFDEWFMLSGRDD